MEEKTSLDEILSESEVAILNHEDEVNYRADLVILTQIKRMPLEYLKTFDEYNPYPEYKDDFRLLQMAWINNEKEYIQHRPGHEDTPVDEMELVEDLVKYNNGLRYRAYFTMRFPHKMKPRYS